MDQNDSKPNILFLMTDMHQRKAVGCYGNPAIETPNLDRLAADGIRFDRAYVQNPVCMPSRASLMTGRYVHSHGVTRNLMGLACPETTVMEMLSRHGYHTTAVGKMHMMPKHGPFGFQYLDLVTGKRCSPHPYNDNYTDFLCRSGKKHPEPEATLDFIFRGAANPLPADDHIDAYIGQKAIQYLKKKKREPFFLWVSFAGPHHPFDPPAPYYDKYKHKHLTLPTIDLVDREQKLKLHPEFGGLDPAYMTTEAIRSGIAHYYGSVTFIDEWIGRILQTLDNEGLAKNTLVIFMPDHGIFLGEHGLWWHGMQTMYDEIVRVPLLIRYPYVAGKGLVSQAGVEAIDLVATFLDVAGVQIPETIQGKSLLPLLQEPSGQGRRLIFSEGCAFERPLLDEQGKLIVGTEKRIMCTDGEYKYIYCHEHEYQELYHLTQDPGETRNLVSQDQFAPVVRAFKDHILSWLIQTQHPRVGTVGPIEDFTDYDASPAVWPGCDRPLEIEYADP